MKFHIEKLGCIDKADIELGDLTILCGDNNTGKTYISYSIYGFLKFCRENADFGLHRETNDLLTKGMLKIELKLLEKKLYDIINSICKKYKKNIYQVFSSYEDYFNDTSFYCFIEDYTATYNYHIEKKLFSRDMFSRDNIFLNALKEKHSSVLGINLFLEDKNFIPNVQHIQPIINFLLWESFFTDYFPKPFIITAERNGIALFQRGLDISKNIWIEKLQEFGKSKSKIEFDDQIMSRYNAPIKDGLDFVRDIPDICKKKSQLIKEYPELDKELRKIAGGDYKVENDQVFFSFKRGRKTQIIPLYMGSSTAKSLLDFNIYIKHLAKKGDILMIDEPELNLHPANQRRMARLLVRLIKTGIKVFVTTHSDYLIQELNNLIVLGNKFDNRNKIMKKYGYSEDDVLDKNKVKLYTAEDNTFKSVRITDLGMEVSSFDREIREMNRIYDDMTVSMDIAYGNN